MRVIIKKIICRFFELFIPSSLIFEFHHIIDNPEICKSRCILSYDRFTSLIEKYSCYDSVEKVVKNPGKRRIAITFDDGMSDVYEVAYPYLKSKNIPFTVFIISDFLDTPGYMTSEQLKLLSEDPLVTIGSHGVSHEILSDMTAEQQHNELYGSKEHIEKIIGKKVSLFAYSHGFYDLNTLKLMKIYNYGFSTRELPLNFLTRSKYVLPRYGFQNENYDANVKKIEQFIRE